MFVRCSCALASFAYAARMKRLGHGYYLGAVAGLYISRDDSRVIYGGPMPRTVMLPHQGRRRRNPAG
jgi:hypothetical protein